ncbi:hypothetical protein ACHAWF_005394 [Thalassiosira exigua]
MQTMSRGLACPIVGKEAPTAGMMTNDDPSVTSRKEQSSYERLARLERGSSTTIAFRGDAIIHIVASNKAPGVSRRSKRNTSNSKETTTMVRFYNGDSVDRYDEEKTSEKASECSFANDAEEVTSHIGSLDITHGVPDLPVIEGNDDVQSAKAASKHKRYKILALLGILFVIAVVLVAVLASNPNEKDAATAQGVVQANEQPQNEEEPPAIVETLTDTEDVVTEEYYEYDVVTTGATASAVETSTGATTTIATAAAAEAEAESTTVAAAQTTYADPTTPAPPATSALPAAAENEDEDEMNMAAWDPESYDEPGKDELDEMGCYDSLSGIVCCYAGFFCD